MIVIETIKADSWGHFGTKFGPKSLIWKKVCSKIVYDEISKICQKFVPNLYFGANFV